MWTLEWKRGYQIESEDWLLIHPCIPTSLGIWSCETQSAGLAIPVQYISWGE